MSVMDIDYFRSACTTDLIHSIEENAVKKSTNLHNN